MSEAFALRRAYSHLLDSLRLQKYNLKEAEKKLETITETTYRDELSFLAEKETNPSETTNMYVAWFQTPDLNNDVIKKVVASMDSHKAIRCIIVIRGKITHYVVPILRILQLQKKVIKIFTETQLQIDPTLHVDVPRHIICSTKTKEEILEQYNIKQSQLPSISSNDPIVQRIGAVKGQMIKILRPYPEENGGEKGMYEITYRIVIDLPVSKKKAKTLK